MISPCKTQPPAVAENIDGQPEAGPSVDVIVWSYSNTPDVGDVSKIGNVEFPKVATVSDDEPLTIFRTTVVSLIVSSPDAETS